MNATRAASRKRTTNTKGSNIKGPNNALQPQPQTLERLLQHLQIEHVPPHLSGRTEQQDRIQQDIEASISRSGGEGHILYLYGQPGTGKTATVRHVCTPLIDRTSSPKVHYHEINALTLTSPGNLFVALYRAITADEKSVHRGKRPTTISACFEGLEKRFRNSKKPKDHHIIVIDEFDNLMAVRPGKETKDFHDRLYSLFDWPASTGAGLTLVCIANTLCLPKFLLPRCFSRLGFGHINFPTYTFEELTEILRDRFKNADCPMEPFMDEAALILLCRKVAALSGDVRLALSLSHSLLKESATKKGGIVTPSDVTSRTKTLFNSAIADFAAELSYHTTLILFCIVRLFLKNSTPDESLGFAVKMLEVRDAYCQMLSSINDELTESNAITVDVETLMMDSLDELCTSGVLQWAYHMPVRTDVPRGRGSKHSRGRRCDQQGLQRWGQSAVTLMMSPAELVTGIENGKRLKGNHYETGMRVLRAQLSLS